MININEKKIRNYFGLLFFVSLPVLFQSNTYLAVAAVLCCTLFLIYCRAATILAFSRATPCIRAASSKLIMVTIPVAVVLWTKILFVSSLDEDYLRQGVFYLAIASLILYLWKFVRAAYVSFFLRGCMYATIYNIIYVFSIYWVNDFPERVHWNSQLGAFFLVCSTIGLSKKPAMHQIFAYILISLGITSIYLSGTRVAMILLIALLVTKAAHEFYKKVSRKENSYLLSLSLIILVLCFNGISSVQYRLMEITKTLDVRNIHEANQEKFNNSLEIRAEIYRASIQTYLKEPRLIHIEKVDVISDILPNVKENFLEDISYHTHLHSSYLDILLTFGLVGLAYFIFAQYVLFRMAIKNRRSRAGVLLSLTFVMIILLSLFDSYFASIKEILLFFIFVGMANSLTKSRNSTSAVATAVVMKKL